VKLSESHQDKLKRRAERLGILTQQGGAQRLMPRLNKDPTAMSAYHAKNQLKAQLAQPSPPRKASSEQMWAARPKMQTVIALPPNGILLPDIKNPEQIDRDHSAIHIAEASVDLSPAAKQDTRGSTEPQQSSKRTLGATNAKIKIYMACASKNQHASPALTDANRNTTSAQARENLHDLAADTTKGHKPAKKWAKLGHQKWTPMAEPSKKISKADPQVTMDTSDTENAEASLHPATSKDLSSPPRR